MSRIVSFRIDEQSEEIVNKYISNFGGNKSKAMCHIIKSYENNLVQGLYVISPQSVARIVDYLNEIQNTYEDSKDICREIRKELISYAQDNNFRQ